MGYVTFKSSLGGGGIYTCYGSQCPPSSPHSLIPQFYPGIPELAQYGDANSQENAARQINAQVKSSIQAQIVELQQRSSMAAKEAQAVLDDLMILDNWVRSVKPPYPEAPLVPPHRRAAQLVQDILDVTPKPAPQPVQTQNTQTQTTQSQQTDSTGLIPESYYETSEGASPNKNMLVIAGIIASLCVGAAIALR